MKEAAKFAESTQILMNVSEFTDVSQATDTLISAVQAFGYTAETSMEVVDLMNIIGNNYAISTADLAKSLTKSSASLVAAGGNLAEAAALTATANAIIQDADSVGTALKTTSLRLRGTSVKVLEEEGLDSDGAVESTSKLRSQVLATSGVDILTDTGAYKSTYQILLEIAEVWDQITDDKARAGLLELLAGKRNSSVIAALLQNPEDLKAAYEDANNAEGSALKENERYLDSIQGKIDQFNNALQAMWSDALDSDWVKGFVEFGTILIKIIDKIGLLNSALIALATISMVKNKMGPLEFFTNLFDTLKQAPGKIKDFAKSFLKVPSATSKAAKALDDATLSVSNFQESLSKAGLDGDAQKSIFSQLGLDGANSDFKINKETFNADKLVDLANNGTIEKSQADQLASVFGLKDAYKELTAEQMSNAMSTLNLTDQQKAAIVNTLDLGSGSKLLTQNQIEQAFASNGLAAADGTLAAANVGLTTTNTGLAASFKALWAAMWPVLAVMGAIAAVYGVVKWFDVRIDTTEELREELDELKSELRDVQSELESVNSELKTTEDRMAELLAKDSLTFTEEEELENLKKQNDELQRKIDLLELEEKHKLKDTAKKFNKTMDSNVNESGEYISSDDTEKLYDDWYDYINPYRWGQSAYHAIGDDTGTEDQLIKEQLKKYESLQEDLVEQENKIIESKGKDKKATKKKKEIEKELEEIGSFITKKTTEFNQDAEGLKYGIDPETDKWLDYINNLQDKFAIISGGKNAEVNAINRIFNKDEFSGASEEIDNLVEKLKEKPGDKTIINDIREQCKLAEDDLKAVGLSADKAVKLFTSFGSDANYSTIEGKTKEITEATSRLSELLYKGGSQGVGSGDFVGPLTKQQQEFAKFFDKEGNVLSEKIAEYFGGKDGGISPETQATIERIVQQVHDGQLSVEQAMKSFNAYGMVESWKIVEAQVSELNTEVFKGLGDEISGVIDTVKELSSAFESVASSIDLVSQAEAEMAYSEHLSIETALQLMESTDDWNSVLKIEEGNIELVNSAEQALVQTKLDLIKKNLQTALSTVEAQLAQISATEASGDMAYTIEESTNVAVQSLAGNMAYLTKMMEAYARIAKGEDVNLDQFMADAKTAQETVISQTNYKKHAAEKIGREDLEKERDRLKTMISIVETGDTRAEFENNYFADKVSGGNKTKEDVKDDAFQREMEYWENRIGANQSLYEQLQNDIDLLEKKGQIAGESYYQAQIDVEKEHLRHLKDQRAEATEFLKGEKPGTERWWEIANTLNDIEGEIDGVTASIQDLSDAMAQVHWDVFDQAHERMDDLTAQLSNVREILSADEDSFFTDEGEWSDTGIAVLATHIQDIAVAESTLADVEEELGNLKMSDFDSEDKYYDKLTELTEKQQGYTMAISDSKQAVVDMYESNIDAVEEYFDKLIENYNDYIDSVKEALDAERDLYEFKKNIQKQSKDIAEIERRIASLSGSTNASDVAERRKLEAELYESRESLNDTYYDHAKQSQQDALDAEATAYEETLTKMVEGMRLGLKEATTNMQTFLDRVTIAVSMNAEDVSKKYQGTELYLSPALTNPWEAAKKAVGEYGGDANNLMDVWAKDGYFAKFSSEAGTNLKSPFNAGKTAADEFGKSVGSAMTNVYTNIQSNVQKSVTELDKIKQKYKEINDEASKPPSGNDGGGGETVSVGTDIVAAIGAATANAIKLRGLMKTSKEMILGSKSFVDANTETINGVKYYRDSKTGYYYKISDLNPNRKYDGGRTTGWAIPKGTWFYTKHAKGTTGVPDDELAIVDEFGPELILHADPTTGRLQYLTRGSGVVPHDATVELMKLADLGISGLMDTNKFGANVNMISNAINKPEIVIDVENFLKVDRVDKDSLPQLEAMMDKKIDTFAKQLNYSIKKFSR